MPNNSSNSVAHESHGPAYAEALALLFERERETKSTWRYQEHGVATDEPPVVGRLYVKKTALALLGNPERLQVTIKPDS
jgi:hypothetical protein